MSSPASTQQPAPSRPRIIVIGVGGFAEKRATEALTGMDVSIGKVLHPSPASPAANRGWAEAATRQLIAQGVWH
jgi:single-strand selective monofunctional uracil DNA glycosylase